MREYPKLGKHSLICIQMCPGFWAHLRTLHSGLIQCSKLVKIVTCPQGRLPSKSVHPHEKRSAHTSLQWGLFKWNTGFWLWFTKVAISPLIMVRFEKFKNCHSQESKSLSVRTSFYPPRAEDGLYLEHWAHMCRFLSVVWSLDLTKNH